MSKDNFSLTNFFCATKYLKKSEKRYSFPAKQNTIYVMVKTKHKYQYDKRNPILDTTNFPIGSLVLQYPKKRQEKKDPFFP